MTKILLDTSFIVHCADYKLDFISELDRLFGKYSLFIIDKTIEELEKLSKSNNKSGIAAKLAKTIIANIKPKQIHSDKYVDDAILEEIVKDKYFVATNDAELKGKILAKKTSVIVLRQKNHLEVLES